MRADAGVSAAGRDRAYYEERRRARERARRLRRGLLVGGAVLFLIPVFGVGFGFAGSSDRMAGGVKIAGVDVGGMTADEARRALERRAGQAASEPVVFVQGEHRFSLQPESVGVAVDWDRAIAAALDRGDGFSLFRGFKRLTLRFSGADVTPAATADEAAVGKEVRRFAAEVDQAPREAAIVLDGLSPVVEPAQTGVELDAAAAAKVVVAALSSFERSASVKLPVRVAEPKVRAADLQPVAAKVRTALSAPVRLSLGKASLTMQPEDVARFLVLPANGSKELGIGSDLADRYFASVAKDVNRKPRDADFELNSRGKVRIVPSREGRTLDVEATTKALLAAALRPAPRSARLAVATAQPNLTTAKAKAMGITGTVGTYTTIYGGVANRIHNVQLVAELIDDHLIAPGATFSFNKTTGERNAEKGFLEAPVIINGELQTGLGGGVCQVSTTVFNAAFEAGLPITERTNHALYISHYPTGRDATVNYPDTDLEFVNDTGHWLWVRAFIGSSELTVTLYGAPVHRRVVSEPSALVSNGSPPLKKLSDPTLYKGEKVVESYGTPSRSVSVRRIVYDENGTVLYDTTWSSYYRGEPKIVRVGTKPKPKEDKPPKDDSGGGGSTSGGGGGAGGGGDAGSGDTGGGNTGGGNTGGGSPPPPPTGKPL